MKKQGALIIFSVCLCAAISSSASSEIEPTDDEALRVIQELMIIGYTQNKLNTISVLLEEFSKQAKLANLTLVGTQNVYDADGGLKEIRTIELALPYHLWSKFSEDDYDFYSEDFKKLRYLRDRIEELRLVGFDMDFNYHSENRLGIITDGVYIDPDTTVLMLDRLNILNQTIEVENRKEAKDIVKNWKPDPIPISHLCFDKDGNFLKNESLIIPELMVTLTDEFGSPKESLIKIAQQGLAEVYLSSDNKEDVPQKLQDYMHEHMQDNAFVVTLDDPSGQSILKDYGMTLMYYFVDGDDTTYTVNIYGYKPSS